MITIAGGTGTVGSKVTRQLLGEGAQVRVLTRDPGSAATLLGADPRLEITGVDFGDAGSLRAAFRGSDTAFLSMGTSATQVRDEKALIDAATGAGVPYLVNLSVGGAGRGIANNVLDWHTEIDAYATSKDVATTLVRPTTYLDTMDRVAAGFAPTGAWGGHAGDGRCAFIDTRDVADVAARILLDGAGRHAGRVYDISGPAAITMPELAGFLSAGLGTVEYHDRTRAEQRAVLESAGLPPLRVEVLLGLDDLTRDNVFAEPSPTTRELTGRDPRGPQAYVASAH